MFNITISNHPTFSEITRKVEIYDLKFDEINKSISIDLKVKHFIDETFIGDLDRTVSLFINNSATFLVAEGNPVGDYDYFVGMAEAGAPLKSLIEAGVSVRDTDGIINSKCNYR